LDVALVVVVVYRADGGACVDQALDTLSQSVTLLVLTWLSPIVVVVVAVDVRLHGNRGRGRPLTGAAGAAA
jgi:hypothetical protein